SAARPSRPLAVFLSHGFASPCSFACFLVSSFRDISRRGYPATLGLFGMKLVNRYEAKRFLQSWFGNSTRVRRQEPPPRCGGRAAVFRTGNEYHYAGRIGQRSAGNQSRIEILRSGTAG